MFSALLMGFAAGFVATPHCLGMCGGFPLQLARSSSGGAVWLRQALFVTGKTFTYMFLGALAALLGVVLLADTTFASAAPVLRLAAGLITVMFGLSMLGIRLPSIRGVSGAGIARGLLGGLVTSPSPAAALTLGLGVGFLPCPLPMAMLAAAAASHNVFHGMALMAGIGLGTAPGLIGVGLFGIGLDRKFAKVGMKAAGCIVLAIGLMTIGRVVVSVAYPTSGAPSCCSHGQP